MTKCKSYAILVSQSSELGVVFLVYTIESQINEFLVEYKRSRVIAETSVRAILKRAIEWEKKFNKPFYRFTKEEALEMFRAVNAVSATSLLNFNLILKHASSWILFTKNENTESVYDEINKGDLKKCINRNKKRKMLLTYEQMMDIQGELLNATDSAIILLLFAGLGGKWCSELTYLTEQQVSKENMCIYFKNGKKIEINEYIYGVLQKAFNETELISYSATAKVSQVTSLGIYKLRCNTLNTNADSHNELDMERRFRWLQRRLYIVSQYFDIPLTVGAIQDSGLLHHIKIGMEESGLPFRKYLYSDEGRKLAERYDIFSEHAPSILIEKFKMHFEEE